MEMQNANKSDDADEKTSMMSTETQDQKTGLSCFFTDLSAFVHICFMHSDFLVVPCNFLEGFFAKSANIGISNPIVKEPILGITGIWFHN